MWNTAYLESRILTASPVGLVQILYQAALSAVREARTQLAEGDIAARTAAISKALDILTELAASLNFRKGGEIGRNLAALYNYMQQRLLEANMKQADAPLIETLGLLATLAEAWSNVEGLVENPGQPGPEEPSALMSGWEDQSASDSQGWSL